MKSLAKNIVYFFFVTIFLASASLAQAQNGNNNSGAGNGNGNGNGNITGNVGGASLNYRRQAPAVVAPGLAAAGIEACLGSVSLGGSGAGFGFSFGTTKLDQGCNIRLYARTLQAMGYRRAATQMLCYDAQVAGALATEGIRCQVGPTAGPQAGVAAMQQPAQRFARDSAPASSADQPARRKCMRYDIFRGCLD